jgi:hypothetical protein
LIDDSQAQHVPRINTRDVESPLYLVLRTVRQPLVEIRVLGPEICISGLEVEIAEKPVGSGDLASPEGRVFYIRVLENLEAHLIAQLLVEHDVDEVRYVVVKEIDVPVERIPPPVGPYLEAVRFLGLEVGVSEDYVAERRMVVEIVALF